MSRETIMSSEDMRYFADRAAVERKRAVTAPSPQIAHAHEQLATLYVDFIERMVAA